MMLHCERRSLGFDAMDLKQMQYFLCLAQERNVTRAARRLNLVQPALSMQIAKLETVLGKQLFFRTAQGMSLTPAGEEFERLVAPIIKDIYRAREEMARLDGKVAGRVSIGMINSAAQSILPVSTLRIAKAYPDIELSICEGYSETMLEWVLAGQLDLAIVNARQRGGAPPMQPILDEEMMLAHAASSERTLPKQVSFPAIRKLDLVIPSRLTACGGSWMRPRPMPALRCHRGWRWTRCPPSAASWLRPRWRRSCRALRCAPRSKPARSARIACARR